MLNRKLSQLTTLAAGVALALAGTGAALAGGGYEHKDKNTEKMGAHHADKRSSDTRATTAEARDAFREGQIWATFVTNPALESYELEVDVRGDRALLSGTVDSEAERRLAERVAQRTDGIEHVDNNILVRTGYVVTTVVDAEPDFGDFVADATTSAMIESKLMWNTRTDALDIDVDTREGVVTLTGTADTPASRSLAGLLAADTYGVTRVINNLRVENDAGGQVATARAGDGDGELSDAWVAAKVDSMLLWSNAVDGTDIDVEADDGVVRLKGTIDSQYEKQMAVDLAQGIRGVNRVDASGLKMADLEVAIID